MHSVKDTLSELLRDGYSVENLYALLLHGKPDLEKFHGRCKKCFGVVLKDNLTADFNPTQLCICEVPEFIKNNAELWVELKRIRPKEKNV